MTQRVSPERTRDVDWVGIFLCVVGGLGFYLSAKEAFAYRVLIGVGKILPYPSLYHFFNQLFLPVLTMLLLISGGGVLQRRRWARGLVFSQAVVGFSLFAILNADGLIRLTKSQPSPPIVISTALYFFVYLTWGFLIWFFLREPVKLQFMEFEVSDEEDQKGPKKGDSDISYEPLPEELRE